EPTGPRLLPVEAAPLLTPTATAEALVFTGDGVRVEFPQTLDAARFIQSTGGGIALWTRPVGLVVGDAAMRPLAPATLTHTRTASGDRVTYSGLSQDLTLRFRLYGRTMEQ